MEQYRRQLERGGIAFYNGVEFIRTLISSHRER
jgi:hypothetical protein